MKPCCFALVMLVISAIPLNAPGQEISKKANEGADKADPAATKLMSDTHSSWAHWEDFPGFTADLEVNQDGKIAKGSVQVSPQGKVTLDLAAPGARSWAKEVLVSIVGHRLGQRLDVNTPCAFVDDDKSHPLGRAVRVIGDPPGTSYRIRDQQVIEVNRLMNGMRYTHIVLENRQNKDKKHLTTSFAANMWDAKSGALLRTDFNHQTWDRIGKFDVPVAVTRITSQGNSKLEIGTLKLSNIKLTAASAR